MGGLSLLLPVSSTVAFCLCSYGWLWWGLSLLLVLVPGIEGNRGGEEGNLEVGQLSQARFWFWNQKEVGKAVEMLSLQPQLESSG